ncbi:MAG: peptidyl-prolyl cis-trans isomerase [Burkholderiales bacterium]|nr:MAG: peptidyl-prolyl cis-trans isomerase [Burkholderiales bacterium]
MSTDLRFHTSFGIIGIELDHGAAPISSENFLQYARDGHFDGTIFHRVIPGFVIQGGGFDTKGVQRPTRAPIENEATNGLKNEKYTLSMARTQAPHSATSQFFINVADNAFLDHTAPSPQGWGYAVFGRVVEGTDVVDRIVEVPTGSRGPHSDWPVEDVVVERTEVLAD